MNSRTSPTLRRRELGNLLRGYREARGLTAIAVAKALDIDPAQISRLENAQRRPQLVYVRDLCRFYELDPEVTEHLLRVAREGREAGWWQQYDLEASTATFIDVESAASHICDFEFSVVPGLLQTPAYAAEVVRPVRADFSDRQITQTIESRLARQAILAGDNPLQYHVILDEGVLHRAIGGARTMCDQLQHLLDASARPNVMLQVLPFSAGASPGLDGAFMVLHFVGGLPGVAYTESQLGQTFHDRPEDVDRCQRAFLTLAGLAADEETTRKMIQRKISEITIDLESGLNDEFVAN